MNSKQEAKISMYDAVITFCNDNAAVVAMIPAFTTAFGTLQTKYADIIATARLEMNAISGITIDKAVAKNNLAQQAADIAAAVFAFASANGNNELKEQARYSVSKLQGLKDELLAPACQSIHDIANANLLALADYGINAAVLSSFQDTIEDYEATIPGPRNATSLRVTYANTIKSLIKETDSILKEQMDKIVNQYKTLNPSFYSTYKTNRIIIDAATSSTQVTGTITNASNGDPLPGVTITVTGESYTATSDNNGIFKLKIPKSGAFELLFTKPTFENKNVNNVITSLGQSTQLNVTMVAMPA